MRTGIFIDAEYLKSNGGWGARYDVLRNFVAAQGADVQKAQVYLSADFEAEDEDPALYNKNESYRNRLRQHAFLIREIPVRKYPAAENKVVVKKQVLVDLIVDVMLQARSLDRVVLVAGSGDLFPLVAALHSMGIRVDLIGLHNVNNDLRRSVDWFFSGFLIPGFIQVQDGRRIGVINTVNEEKYWGFITTYNGFDLENDAEPVFFHGTKISGGQLSNGALAKLGLTRPVVEFTLTEGHDGKTAAEDVRILRPISFVPEGPVTGTGPLVEPAASV